MNIERTYNIMDQNSREIVPQRYATALKIENGDTLFFVKGKKSSEKGVKIAHLGNGHREISVSGLESLFGAYKVHREGIIRDPHNDMDDLRQAFENDEIDLAIVPARLNPRGDERLPIITSLQAKLHSEGETSSTISMPMHLIGRGYIERRRK